MAELDGKVALVTGAGSGMGRETALLLAASGATVVVVGRRAEPLESLRGTIADAGGRAIVEVADVSADGAADDLIARVAAQVGPVDILVNNAGSSSSVLNPQWMPEEQWRAVIDVNLTAVFLLSRAVLSGMLERGAGTIITVSSLAAATPNLLGGAAYGAAKAGVRNFMTFLHTTFRGEGLRAITVLPGEADTPILDNRARPPHAEERANMVQPIDVARAVHLAATLPQRTVLQEIVVAPTKQRDTSVDLEISRWLGAPQHLQPATAPDEETRA
ncbi:SDR family oxidoreductase [Microbacterium sp. NPDC056044]|uniref:SDR family oxidoreductase n=1 Tax=Microbacterium sp. NPDC056044 TaxID=3345690 RepID=UPI0035DAD9C4